MGGKLIDPRVGKWRSACEGQRKNAREKERERETLVISWAFGSPAINRLKGPVLFILLMEYRVSCGAKSNCRKETRCVTVPIGSR